MEFPVPPYTVIDITEKKATDTQSYLLQKLQEVGIPQFPGDRVGVTIRVSMPGQLDKLTVHGGLHVTEKEEVLRQIIEKYQKYGSESKIIVQHTVDAKCSGALLKEHNHAFLESIYGDAPPLLEGATNNYEKYVLDLKVLQWKKERSFTSDGKEAVVLTPDYLCVFSRLIEKLRPSAYLEWSISKNSKFYFYEYCQLKSQTGLR